MALICRKLTMVNYNEKNRDLKAECIQHTAEKGLPIPEPMIADGNIHRYSADHKQNERDEWYIAHEGISTKGNPYLICIYGSWSTGSKFEFRSFDQSGEYDANEPQELRELLKRKQEEAEKELKIIHNRAAEEAAKIWQASDDSPSSESYIYYAKVKGIAPVNIKFGCNPSGFPAMIIDLRNSADEILTSPGEGALSLSVTGACANAPCALVWPS